MHEIEYGIEPELSDRDLNDLFASAWKRHAEREFGPVLERSLTYFGAFDGTRLVGLVNMAWDGGVHGFILDTTVHRDSQRRGIGTEMMKRAADIAAERRMEWLHVDYGPHLDAFYRGCGYLFIDDALHDSFDLIAWIAQIAPVDECFQNEFGTTVALLSNLIRPELSDSRLEGDCGSHQS